MSGQPIQGQMIFARYEQRLESKGTKQHTRNNFRRIAGLFSEVSPAHAPRTRAAGTDSATPPDNQSSSAYPIV